MNGRTIILAVVALAIAVIAAIIVKNRAQGIGEGGPKVMVAATNIDAGAFVRSDKDLAWKPWPAGDISPSFFVPDTARIEDFNGSVARRAILAGEPITATSVVRVKDGGFLSAVLSPGMRAISIAVSPTTGNAGFIFPGDRVDLILTHRIPVKEGDAAKERLASETFIRNVRVVAVDQMLDNPENKAMIAKTITLEVMPKQAEMVNVATNLGAISVSLRSLANAQPQNTEASATASPTTEADVNAAAQEIMRSAAETEAPVQNYSTDNDVSKLMGDSAVRSKVHVIRGSTTEQIDFQQQGGR